MKYFLARIVAPLSLSFIIISLFLACQKESSPNNNNNNNNQQPPVKVSGSVAGVVTDINDVPVSNVTVTAGTSTATTDANGKFSISNAQLNEGAGFATAIKNGYFASARTFLISNSVNNIKIQLIPKITVGKFDASAGGNVTISGGAGVNFNPGFANAVGNSAYSGSVTVAGSYIDPSVKNSGLPGDGQCVNASGKTGVLTSFGTVVVEMNDDLGNRLQLASGTTATVSIPIPASQQGSAPGSISLWYFNDSTGLWKEEGTASRQGTAYVGTVKHFSYWTSGIYSQTILLSGVVKDANGNPYANKTYSIGGADSTFLSLKTDSTGAIDMLIPSGIALTFKVLTDCGDVVYASPIGPYSNDTNLGSLIVAKDNCNLAAFDSDQYIYLTLDGVNYSWKGTQVSEQNDTTTFIMGGVPSGNPDSSYFSLGIYDQGNGVAGSSYGYSFHAVIIGGPDVFSQYDPFNASFPQIAPTVFDPVGGYIQGTASGLTQDNLTYSFDFKVRRVQ